MGQYWIPVNLDKKEFIDPHKLGSGLKLWEQLASHPGTGTALVVLCAAMPEPRGGGDLDMNANWHGSTPGPMPASYPALAKAIIGRWAGDRIALVGDYAEDSDLPPEHETSEIYRQCRDGKYTDITNGVVAVIEHELNGKFVGAGWKDFVQSGNS